MPMHSFRLPSLASMQTSLSPGPLVGDAELKTDDGNDVGALLTGAALGLPCGTVGPGVVGAPLLGPPLGLRVGSLTEGIPGPTVGLPLGSNVGMPETGAKLGLPLLTVGPGDETCPEGLLVGPSLGPPAGAEVTFPDVGALLTGAALGLPCGTVGPDDAVICGAVMGA